MNVIKKAVVFIFLLPFLLKAQRGIDHLSPAQTKQLAIAAERINDWESASIYYQAYINKKPDDIAISYQLAENYRKIGDVEKAKEMYKRVYELAESKFPLASFYYGRMLVACGNCQEAIPIFNEFRKEYRGKKEDRKYIRLAKFSIEGCGKSNDKIAKNENFITTPFNQSVNGLHIEASPIYLSDSKMVYNSLKTKGQTIFNIDDSLPKRKYYMLKKEDNSWSENGIWEMTSDIDSEIANGAFNQDKTIFYFTICKKNATGNTLCDIYRKKLVNKRWSKSERLPETVNSQRFTESQIAVGMDDKGREVIYFVSDRKEGKGGLDIWYSTYYVNKDEYREAKNAGSKINSVGDEITPFISPIDGTLFFSSDGHPGFGGFDIFRTVGQRSKWIEPENIGVSINSTADELYYVLNENGEEGVFVSNRLKKGESKRFCCDDIYEFKELNKIKIELIGVVELADEDSYTKADNTALKLFIIDSENDEEILVQNRKTDLDGNYEMQLAPNQDYIVRTVKEGYLLSEKRISTHGVNNNKQITHNFSLESYRNRSIIIENIYYKFDRSELTDDAMNTIDTTIYEILIDNPLIIVEISSHTDSKGTDEYNDHLSQQRAESVVKYLRKKGIPKNRMTAKGYGEQKPIASNTNEDGSDNEKGRAKNRRTEFKVIGELDVEIEYEE